MWLIGKVSGLKYDRNVFRGVTLIIQFGINMLVPILICTFLGMFLDKVFHTSFITIILFFLGAAAGFRNIFIFAGSMDKKRSYLGSDAESRLKDISEGRNPNVKEDFVEAIDRIYRENMNE